MHPGALAPSVLCLGAVVQDTLAISHGPLQLGDDMPGTALVRPGGVATNIALALAHRGVHTGLAGAVGQDATGQHLITTLQAARVDCTHLLQRPGTSDQVVTLENPDGERFAAVADCRQLDAAATEQPDAFEAAVRAWDGEIVLDGNLPADLIARLLDAAQHSAYLVPASRAKAAHLGAVIRDHRLSPLCHPARRAGGSANRGPFPAPKPTAAGCIRAAAG